MYRKTGLLLFCSFFALATHADDYIDLSGMWVAGEGVRVEGSQAHGFNPPKVEFAMRQLNPSAKSMGYKEGDVVFIGTHFGTFVSGIYGLYIPLTSSCTALVPAAAILRPSDDGTRIDINIEKIKDGWYCGEYYTSVPINFNTSWTRSVK